MLFLIFLFVLTVVYAGLAGLRLLGYDSQRIHTFETMHYWAYLVVLGLLLIDLIIRVTLYVTSHASRKK
jgi:hypothetical protein